MSKLLINESPLQVLPTLARYVGLNEAIILQQVHFWLGNKKTGKIDKNGVKWVRNTITEWQEDNFPFWSEPTIKRAINNLVSDNLLKWTDKLNKAGYDRTRWYTVNYELLDTLDAPVDRIAKLNKSRKKASCKATGAKYQDDILPGKVSSRSNATDHNDTMDGIIVSPTIPETTTETTTDNGALRQTELTQQQKDELLLFGKHPNGQYQESYDTIQEIQNAGWQIRNHVVEQGVAYYLEMVREYKKGFSIPNNPSIRKDWYKSVEEHLMDHRIDDLKQLYRLAIGKLEKAGMSYVRPGALTKTLPEVAGEASESGVVAQF